VAVATVVADSQSATAIVTTERVAVGMVALTVHG
jgi:hypothetical protein